MSLRPLQQYYYSRYGLADVLLHELGASRSTVSDTLAELTEDAFEEAAEERLRDLKMELRIQFPTEALAPEETVEGHRVTEPDGTPGEQVAENGFYTRPHVLLDAGGLNGRYGLLKGYLPSKKKLLQRYYPPASKLSIGKKSADNAKASRAFILACQVTTLTTAKAARKMGDADRAAVIPDLPLPDLLPYMRLLEWMQSKGTHPARGTVNRSGDGVRLEGNDGNFPEAPPQWAFGSLGVMAAIGTWARENQTLRRAEPVLAALTNQRFYVVTTSGTTRSERVGGHLYELATRFRLAPILREAWKVETNMEQDEFYRVFRRWLLRFDEPTFLDFLAVRATYPPAFTPIIDFYFMQRFDDDLINSARVAAQHISDQAYHATDENLSAEDRRASKEATLAGLESMLYDCEDGPELIARLSVQVGRLTGSSFPPEAQHFFDEVASGAVEPDDARHLLLAYMRLRPERQSSASDESVASADASSGVGAVESVP